MNTSINSSSINDSGTLLNLKPVTKKLFFILGVSICFTQLVSPGIALFIGLAIAQISGHPYIHLNHKATQWLLQASVVGLGFGMNIHSAIEAGKEGILFTVASISTTLISGLLLGKILKIEKQTSFLIASGTAICGGSAIAAIAPVIKAREKQISVALGCIFILNAIALFLFPMVGHYLNMTQDQFGLWCAVAIHDTSSVVGAASKYGNRALEVATTVKLARALWIIPLAFAAGSFFKNGSKKIIPPYFIFLFILAVLLNSFIPTIHSFKPYITFLAKTGLTLSLFLIGAGLSRNVLASVGFKPLMQGTVLWLLISFAALYAIMHLV